MAILRFFSFSSLLAVLAFRSRSCLVSYQLSVNTTSTTDLRFSFLILIILITSRGNHDTILFSAESSLSGSEPSFFPLLVCTLRRLKKAGVMKRTLKWMKEMGGDLGLHTYLRNYTPPGLPAFLCVE